MKLPLSLPERWPVYVLGSAAVLLSFLTVIGERGLFHLWRLHTEKWKLDEQNYRLLKENEALRQRVFRLRHDDAYLEKLAREELNLVRPGEIIYRFAPSPTKTPTSSVNENASRLPRSEERKERR